jgi:hypothetical protein
VRPKRPINADVPAPEGEPREGEEAREAKPPEPPPATAAEPPSPQPSQAPRQPKPLAPKLLAGLVLLAVVFIVAAILGSSGGSDQDTRSAPAPAPGPAGETAGVGETASSQSAEALGYPGFAT